MVSISLPFSFLLSKHTQNNNGTLIVLKILSKGGHLTRSFALVHYNFGFLLSPPIKLTSTVVRFTKRVIRSFTASGMKER